MFLTSACYVNTWWLVTNFNDRLTCFVSDSHNSPIHWIDEGLNFHSTFYELNLDVTKSKWTFFSVMLRSFTAPTSWLPLFDQIMLIFPRHQMNLLIDMAKNGVAKSPVKPHCRPWFDKHIKSTVCCYHVTYMFRSKCTLSSCLNVKERLARNRQDIKFKWFHWDSNPQPLSL